MACWSISPSAGDLGRADVSVQVQRQESEVPAHGRQAEEPLLPGTSALLRPWRAWMGPAQLGGQSASLGLRM